MSEQVLDRLLLTLDVGIESFAICEVASGRQLSANGGPDIEVHYVLEGTMHLHVPGQPSLICGPGSVVLVPPNVAQRIAAAPGPAAEVVAMDNVRVLPNGTHYFDAARGSTGDLRFVCGLIRASISGSFGLLDTIRRPIAEDLSGEDAVRTAFRQLAYERDNPSLASRAISSALMKACLLLLLRRHFLRGEHEVSLLSTLRDPRLGKAVTAVLDKPAARHSVAALASVAGMSRSAFAREFSLAFSMSPMEFVARTRLHQAAELLRSTNLPVKVIAANIGFSSRSHFSRAFRDGYGADPSAFRRAATQLMGRDVPRVLRQPMRPRVATNGHASF